MRVALFILAGGFGMLFAGCFLIAGTHLDTTVNGALVWMAGGLIYAVMAVGVLRDIWLHYEDTAP